MAAASNTALSADQKVKKDTPKGVGPAVPSDLAGWGFGVGIALTFDVDRRSNRIGNATIDANRIVRIQDSSDVIAGFVFESHYFFPFLDNNVAWLGHGPFVAVEMGNTTGESKGIISAYGLGWMVGLRRWKSVRQVGTRYVYEYLDNVSWNIGVGLRVDPNAKTLGSGIVVNQPLPANETTPVRTQTGARYGVMVISSFSF
jgi:hypothetical protein